MNYNCYSLLPDGTPVFNEKGKPDLTRGDIYISVSSVLAMESAGDFLIKWALREFGGLLDPVRGYDSYMEKVSDLGTRLHAFIEADLKGLKYTGEWNDDMAPGIESWISFRKNHEIETVDSERILYSKQMKVAGTLDARLRIDGKLYIVDLKTGTVMPKAMTQLRCYKSMMQEMGLSDGSEELLVLGGSDSKSKIANGGKVMMHTLETMFDGQVSESDLYAQFQCLRYLWGIKNVKSRQFQPVIKGMQEAIDPMIMRFKEQFNQLSEASASTGKKTKPKKGKQKSNV